MKELSTREVQQGAYQVLKKLAALCEKQGWRFFLTYGTLIGAVRHEGIIPWDDDIDIMMPRPDYEKMKKYFCKHEKEMMPLKLFDISTVKKYPHMIARISDQNFYLDFENEKDYGIGLFVDIYPLDGAGNDLTDAIKLLQKTKRLASLCFLTSRKSFAVDNTDSKLKLIIKFPAYLWANLHGNKHYTNKLGKLAKTYDYETSSYIACVSWPGNYVFKKEVLDKIKMVKFEDAMMPIPIEYDEFLSAIYGDYMTPPPESDRKTNHTYRAYQV